MDQVRRNKEFIMSYYNAVSGVRKPVALCEKFVSDPKLLGHIQLWDSALPAYEIFVDELIAEGDRVVVRARMKGHHVGTMPGIPATGKMVELPFVIGYEVVNRKIVSHWLSADQLILMEQLGLEKKTNRLNYFI